MKHSSPIKYCKEYNVLNVSHECRKIHNLVAKSESLKCLGNLKVHLRHSSLQFIRYIVLCSTIIRNPSCFTRFFNYSA